MNEIAGKHAMVPSTTPSSSMAIVQDKRPAHRPGGCVGIFFQLFDWNRRFAKKKLFPKKLLPPVRPTKRVSKKFGGDEKMPMAKFLLIADENRGGFPNAKKPPEIGATRASRNTGPDDRMCHPGPVARLMGLESMPTVPQDKPRKAVDSAFCHDGSETSGSSRHDLVLDLRMGGRGKHEPRPQKLQKTGIFERRPVSTRLGSEALPFNKSVLSRTRKQHHKLASPVKSPRLLCRKNSARLMEAAVKILEPSQRNRGKTLTYLDSSQGHFEGINKSPSTLKNSHGQDSTYCSPCQSCGSLVEVADLKLSIEKPSLVDYECSASGIPSMSSSHETLHSSRLRPPVCSSDGKTQSLAAQAKANVQIRASDLLERKPPSRNELDQRKPGEDVGSRRTPRQGNLRQNQMSLAKERFTARPNAYSGQQNKRDLNATSNGSRDYISMNRNLSNRARPGMTPQASTNAKLETERGTWDKKAVSHKRRPNNNTQIDGLKTNKPNLSKQRTKNDKIPARGTGIRTSCSTSRNGPKSNFRKQVEADPATSNKNSGVVSFTFNAPSKHDCPSVSSVEDVESLTGQDDYVHACASQAEKSVTDSRTGKPSNQRVGTFTGDELSALLEQKIRELNCLDGRVEETHGKSTASILQELISALTKGAPITQEEGDDCKGKVSQMEGQSYNSPDASAAVNHQWREPSKLQEETKRGGAVGISTGSDCDQPSPVSILEVSFSTDSGLSECLIGNTGSKSYFGYTEESWDRSQSWDPDTDLSDSASSHNRRVDNSKSSASMESISIMYNSCPHEIGLLERKPSFVREVISNIELLFGGILAYDLEVDVGSSICSLVLDTLASLLDYAWKNASCNLIFPDIKDKLQFRRFLFDCMVEYLDTRYGCFCKSGYKSWEKLPLFLSSDKLSGEVYADICKWGDLGGKILDDIIEKEMSHLTGKWMDFEIEAFEAGIDIEQDIFQALVDEILLDLFPCRI